MNPSPKTSAPAVPAKLTGWRRVIKATGYSLAGLAAGWREPAFRQEAILALVLVPAAFWLGQSWTETVLLLTVTLLVLVTGGGPHWSRMARAIQARQRHWQRRRVADPVAVWRRLAQRAVAVAVGRGVRCVRLSFQGIGSKLSTV